MKFCPKCGNQLPDDALFCNQCGAKQPAPEVEQKEPAPEPTPTPMPKPEGQAEMSPRQRFNYLYENDERFQCIVKTTKKLRISYLFNTLFIIPFFVNMLIPVGVFTGVGMSGVGAEIFNAYGYTTPYPYSAISLVQFSSLARQGGYALTPGDGLKNPSPLILFIFGFVFIALFFLIAFLGNPKSYLLKTYEGSPEGGNILVTNVLRVSNLIFGPALVIVSLVSGPVMVYVNSTDLKYDATYIFGQVEGLPAGLITAIVVSVIFFIIMLVGGLVTRSIFVKPLKKYAVPVVRKK